MLCIWTLFYLKVVSQIFKITTLMNVTQRQDELDSSGVVDFTANSVKH